MRVAGKDQCDPGSTRFPILQKQFPLVIFHDLFHDSEPQAGALCAGRYVRLGQPLAMLLRRELLAREAADPIRPPESFNDAA